VEITAGVVLIRHSGSDTISQTAGSFGDAHAFFQRITIVNYLFCRHKVVEYDAWRGVFDSHANAQREAGLHVLHVLRGADDPNLVVMLFRVDDVEKAKAFTEAPSASEAGRESGVIGPAEMLYLTE
jgi:hypothetical protein